MLTTISTILVLAVGAAGDAAGEPAPTLTGNAAVGRALFIGQRAFQNGAPPCGACHAVAGEGRAFSASLGPELSAAVKDLDVAALDGLLDLLPFPTMMPVYEGRPLTAEERADLEAFLIPAAQRGPPGPAWELGIPVALVALIPLLGLALAWRRRKRPTRVRLVARAAALHGGSR